MDGVNKCDGVFFSSLCVAPFSRGVFMNFGAPQLQTRSGGTIEANDSPRLENRFAPTTFLVGDNTILATIEVKPNPPESLDELFYFSLVPVPAIPWPFNIHWTPFFNGNFGQFRGSLPQFPE